MLQGSFQGRVMPLAQHSLSIRNTKVFGAKIALSHKGNKSKIIDDIKVISKNELWVSIRMPDTNPENLAGKWFYTCVKSKAKPVPFVVLIDRPYIVYSSCPKTPTMGRRALRRQIRCGS